MPFNGVGVFNRVYQWVNDAANNLDVDATRTDTDSNDIADGLTNCVTRSGQSPATANLPLGSFKLTGLGNGSANTDSVNYGQVFNSPAFVTPSATTTPAPGNNSLLLATTSFIATSFAPLASPAFTGIPTVPTAAPGTNNTQSASTAFAVALAFSASLPAQPGGALPYKLRSVASVASWAPDSCVRSARTSNTILAAADLGALVDITSGTFSQTFTAAATLGTGWWCFLRNNGTGDITLDPNGAELIDGLATYIMYPGECRLVQCDATGFNTIVISSYAKAFTTVGANTWVKPPGYRQHGGLAWCGAASGEKTGASAGASGGAAGGCFQFSLNAADLAATETVTIGAGGAAVTTTGKNAGGNTTFGAWFTVFGATNTTGGAGGSGGAIGIIAAVTSATPDGFAGGSSSSAPQNTIYGGASPGDGTIASGSSIYGGGAGAGIKFDNTPQAAGTSKFAGNGGAASAAGSGTDGAAPGGGGGATGTGAQSGAGARGEVRIHGIA